MARILSVGRALLAGVVIASASAAVPAPPKPEPIEVVELPLPPVSPNTAPGSCNSDVNPRGTGCIAQKGGGSTRDTIGILAQGDFLPDGKHVLTMVTFVGAPNAPDPAAIFSGEQIIIVKTDNKKFPNGDTWKCLTCGIPAANAKNRTELLDYPQAFNDGKRILAGDNIIDCGKHHLTSPKCTPKVTFMYPIRWEASTKGGEGGDIRELRLHPDSVHLGFSSFYNSNGKLGQAAYFSRLQFNPSPKTGLPLVPRYDLVSVTRLIDPDGVAPLSVNGDELEVNRDAITVGELRGFSGRGYEAIYVGYPWESSNIDVFTIHLKTGNIRRLTSHPEYVDPIHVSPDDKWFVIEDTRGSGRQMFMAGMRGIPPVTDLVSTSVTTATRNNGPRRFFQPFLLDHYGDRGEYFGQKINGPGRGVPGSGDIDDPEWNAMAEPRWSPYGNEIVYWQAQTISPECGGDNSLLCYPSKAPGARTYRLMLAKLISRAPKKLPPVTKVSDEIPWGEPYIPGSLPKGRGEPAAGEYTLKGKFAGFADVSFVNREGDPSAPIGTVAAIYHNFSDDGTSFINGWENVTSRSLSPTVNVVDWYSDLVQTGEDEYLATKKTSPDGFHLRIDVLTNYFNANGTLTTTINGKDYKQPANNT
ncbi:saponin hydrolase precursor [Ilyonectria robusta]|uniref:saponin hydrolase precursor n=1 Tax=Ilyonectria robusta TaxID=1079257 RepID=UPI001E8EB29D|nr:saponin hydrolase precursor [Ilyonectria robusta]KAH8665643.1 saponin hydrolase precursor [Ilyonectria robusta]